MVTVKLTGGLGNQMFQYAIGRAISLEKNTDLRLDISFLLDKNPKKNFALRNYSLGIFKIKPKFYFISKILKYLPFGIRFIHWKYVRMLELFKKNYVIHETNFHQYDEELLSKIKSNTYLIGHFQNEKYFSKIKDILIEDFTLKKPVTGDIFDKIINTESVFLHVRRGDYVTDPKVIKEIGFIGLDYYNKAISLIATKINNPHIFVFSDDIKWCREYIKTHTPIDFIDSGSIEADFSLMTSCKHAIISNGSFAWWAGWLIKNKEKIIIAPQKWFASGRQSDIVPQKWIKI